MENREKRRLAVKKYDIVSLAEELGYKVKIIGRDYRTLDTHDSVRIKVSSNTFKQYSTGAYGDSVSFLMNFGEEMTGDSRFKSLDYCIRYLEKKLRLEPDKKITITFDNAPKEKVELVLPEKDDNNRRVYAYLNKSRCIHPDIIKYFLTNNWLYQDSKYKNCVFVSYKEEKPVFMSMRGTGTKKFVAEHPGNDYNHCFYINNNSDTIVVTEAVIDMMSLMTLNINREIHKKHNFLSLNSASKVEALFHHLKNHPEIKDVLLALDNDEAGKTATQKIRERIHKEFKNVEILTLVSKSKDWNQDLQDKEQEKVSQMDCPTRDTGIELG